MMSGRRSSRVLSLQGKELKFAESEISHDCQELDLEQQADIISIANSQLDKLNNQMFLKFKCKDFRVPPTGSASVASLMRTEHLGKWNDEQVTVGMYSVHKESSDPDGLYRAKVTTPIKKVTLSDYSKLAAEGLCLDSFPSGIAFLENFFTRLRNSTRKTPVVFYYAGTDAKVELKDSSIPGFDVANLETPLAKVFKKYKGFNDGVISYIGLSSSGFTIHVDDFEASAFNFVMYGGWKTWLFVHQDHKEKLRKLICQSPLAVGAFKKCRADHKDLFVDPGFLRHHGIRFVVVEQGAGEVIITGRSVFHQGVNFAGTRELVIATACNVLLNDYIDNYHQMKSTFTMCGHKEQSIKITSKEKQEIQVEIDKIRSTMRSIEEAVDGQITGNVPQGTSSSSSSSSGQLDQLTEQFTAQLDDLRNQLILKDIEHARRFAVLESKVTELEAQLAAKQKSCKCGDDHGERENTVPESESTDQRELTTPVVRPSYPNTIAVFDEPPPQSVPTDLTCDKCGRKFVNSRNLRLHHVRHFQVSVKHFQCDSCEKTFLYPASLKAHKKSVHKGVRFECGRCGVSYAYKQKLTAHQMTCKAAGGANVDDSEA